MSPEEALKLKRKAYAVACAYNCYRLAEDFSQEIFLHYLVGRKATVQQLFIDFIRKELGLIGSARSMAIITQFNEQTYRKIEPQPLFDFERHLKKEIHKKIYRLRYEMGYNTADIAKILKMTKGNVCQICHAIRNAIRKSIYSFALNYNACTDAI